MSTKLIHALRQLDKGLILALCLTLPMIETLMRPGLPTTADMPIHLYRTVEYSHAWSSDVWLPRWAPNLAYGYGYPLFIFAPPLPYFIGYIFHALGGSFEIALKTLIILIILLYATSMYLLGRDLWGNVPSGLISATAYLYAPFALREILLYGGNIPQYFAIGLFPLILWTLYRLNRHGGWGWLIAATFAYAALILSHLFHALIFTPAALLFGLWLMIPLTPTLSQWERGQNVSPLPMGEGAGVRALRLCYNLLPLPLGGLLTAFFWLPAFFERYATRAQADIYLQKSPFFIRYPHWSELIAWISPLDSRAANPYVPLTLGIATLSLVALSLIAYLWHVIKSKDLDSAPQVSKPKGLHSNFSFLIFYFSFLISISIYLTLAISRPVWETVTILQVAEFPWRMLGLANMGLAVLAGGAVYAMPLRWRWHLTIVCILWQIGSVAPYLYAVTPFTLYGEPTLDQQLAYERRSQSIGTTTLGEYLPQNVTEIPTGSPLIHAFKDDPMPERLDRNSLPNEATATRLSQTAITHHYQVNSPTAFTLRILQYHYLGWQAWLDGQPLPLTPEAKTGLITLAMPAGEHDLMLHFGETPLRLTAFALSGLALVIMTCLAIFMECKPLGLLFGANLKVCTPVSLPIALTLCFILLIINPLLRPFMTLTSPPNQVNLAQHAANITFQHGIRLIGYDLSATTVTAGGRLQVVLYWQSDREIKGNFQPFVHVDRLSDFTTAAATTNYTPGDVTTESVLPTFHWDTARYVRDEHELIIPADTPPIAFTLRIGLIDGDSQKLLPLADGSADTAQLSFINITNNSWLPATLPDDYTPLQAIFSHETDVITLHGFSLAPRANDQLAFTLAWQSEARPQTDYTVFAQLLDANNQLMASFDSPPLGGAYPTSTWLPQQLIFDPRAIPLANVPPGDYRLVIGLYEAETGARLVTATEGNFVIVTTITIP